MPFLLIEDQGAQYALQHRNDPPAETLSPAVTETAPPETTQPEIPEADTAAPPVTEAPTKPAETEPAETEPISYAVDLSWFDDVLFVGDSRIAGLREYCDLGCAHYYCDVGMTVYAVPSYQLFVRDFGKINLHDLLTRGSFGKIFIHLGLNEVGVNNDRVEQKYQEIVDFIQMKHPDAKIIIQSIMTVTREKAKDPRFSLEQVKDMNARIKAIADAEGLYYLDTNIWAADEEGYLRAEIDEDGAHPTIEGYREWAQWLLDNVGILGIP